MDESTRDDEGCPAVAATLRRLKREGSRLLVSGLVSDAVRAQQTRHLLGSPDEERSRVLALADDSSPSAHLPDRLDPTTDRVRVVEHHGTVRSAAVASAEPLPPRAIGADPLAAFHRDVRSAIDAERRANGPFSPAVLRVGVVGGGALVDRYGAARTERVLRSLGDIVVSRGGMVHCHVATRSDSSVVDTLRPAFDLHVRLRRRDGFPPEQHWSFPETGESTEWMLL